MFCFSLKWDRLVSNLLVIEVHQGLISLLTFLLHAVDCPGNGPDSIIRIAVISEIMWLCNKASRKPQYNMHINSAQLTRTYLLKYLHTIQDIQMNYTCETADFFRFLIKTKVNTWVNIKVN